MKITIDTEVKGGKLTRNRSLIQEAIESFEGRKISLTIDRKKNKRTNDQNRYWFGVVVELVSLRFRDLGHLLSKEAVHELLKMKVAEIDPDLMYQDLVNQETGEVIGKRLRGTSELTTTEFMALKEIVQQWASEILDIYIPDPNEQLTIKP